jgi:peptide methionine sulfoxide reductase MsrB
MLRKLILITTVVLLFMFLSIGILCTGTTMIKEQEHKVTTFYDSVTGKPLFRAPVGRTWNDFRLESERHGWPSFRDAEVITDDTRVLEDGEVVSKDGTHLGHNLPDGKGNRYCINLVSIAGQPPAKDGVEVEDED